MQTEFLIIGDSHCGSPAYAARVLGVPYAGGALFPGRLLRRRFFTVKDGRFVMDDPETNKRLEEYLRRGQLGENLLAVSIPILVTLGFSVDSSIVMPVIRDRLAIAGLPGEQYISAACFEAGVRAGCSGAIAFYRTLTEAGKRVFATYPPQRYRTESIPIARAVQEIIGRLISRLGVTMVDVREETTDDRGVLLKQFESAREGDRVHANPKYGQIALRKFLDMAGISTEQRALSLAAE